VFYLAFRRSLSKRLLSRKFKEADEMNFIGKLKQRCGDAYTKKLEGMFNDIKISSEKQSEFKSWLKEKSTKLPLDTNVVVLNDLYWPLQKGTELVLPGEFTQCITGFEEYYKSSTEKRKLTWLYNQGTVMVQHTFLDDKKRVKRIEVQVSVIQAAMLVLFNDDQPKSFKDIQGELNLSEELLKFSIAPLVYAKFPLLKRKEESTGAEEEEEDKPAEKPAEDKGAEEDAEAEAAKAKKKKAAALAAKKKKAAADKEEEVINDTDVFSLAKETKPPRNRIQYPQGSAHMMKKEHKEIKDKTLEERIIKIELALVRVMKSRNVCTLSELIAEASSQLMQFFRPDPKLMKKRIEALMERGFMRRDENDQRRIHYVA
jgi:hypothetical protein